MKKRTYVRWKVRKVVSTTNCSITFPKNLFQILQSCRSFSEPLGYYPGGAFRGPKEWDADKVFRLCSTSYFECSLPSITTTRQTYRVSILCGKGYQLVTHWLSKPFICFHISQNQIWNGNGLSFLSAGCFRKMKSLYEYLIGKHMYDSFASPFPLTCFLTVELGWGEIACFKRCAFGKPRVLLISNGVRCCFVR